MKIRLEVTRTWKNERKSRDNDKTLIIQSGMYLGMPSKKKIAEKGTLVHIGGRG